MHEHTQRIHACIYTHAYIHTHTLNLEYSHHNLTKLSHLQNTHANTQTHLVLVIQFSVLYHAGHEELEVVLKTVGYTVHQQDGCLGDDI